MSWPISPLGIFGPLSSSSTVCPTSEGANGMGGGSYSTSGVKLPAVDDGNDSGLNWLKSKALHLYSTRVSSGLVTYWNCAVSIRRMETNPSLGRRILVGPRCWDTREVQRTDEALSRPWALVILFATSGTSLSTLPAAVICLVLGDTWNAHRPKQEKLVTSLPPSHQLSMA
ncbi:hypothetical protein PM082_012650 [Marasmius tenuissimus]|nr:hypothetical protein PM082_012650 [Marasmius tenuissimus]